jgi:hypothetical protein
MFPHPQNLITIRAIEREQTLANVERMYRHAGQSPTLPGRARAPKVSFLRRAARAVGMLVG